MSEDPKQNSDLFGLNEYGSQIKKKGKTWELRQNNT